MNLSTHVLDAATGRPATGVAVRLEHADGTVTEARTDDDGRITGWCSTPATTRSSPRSR